MKNNCSSGSGTNAEKIIMHFEKNSRWTLSESSLMNKVLERAKKIWCSNADKNRRQPEF
jgi:hypothetical protein